MRRSLILAAARRRHARCIHRRRQRAAADAARAGRRSGMPRRRQRRFHRRLGDQSRLRAARRRHAGGPLRRDHPQSRSRSRHHPGIGAGLGRVRAGRRGSGPATSPAITPARRAAPRSASASAATCWSAARRIRSRCSRSACRARSASTSPPGWRAWNFGRGGNCSSDSGIDLSAVSARRRKRRVIHVSAYDDDCFRPDSARIRATVDCNRATRHDSAATFSRLPNRATGRSI